MLAAGATASLEVRYWSAAAYLDMLQAAVPASDNDAHWSAPALQAGPHAEAEPGSAWSGGPETILQVLVGDLVTKQAALESLQRTADTATSRGEIALWRLRDMCGRNESLNQAVTELRRLLHDSNSGVEALMREDLHGLSSAELEERCKHMAARLKLERVQNAELIKRLRVRAP